MATTTTITKEIKYITYEEPYADQIFTEQEMREIYNRDINKDVDDCGWATFEDWLHDVVKSGVFEIYTK